MPVGARIGSRLGSPLGSRVGGPVSSSPLAGIPQDAASGVYRPGTLAQWQQVLAAAADTVGDPFFHASLGQASGNDTDTIGGLTFTRGGTVGNILFQQTLTGMSAVGVRLPRDTDCTFFTTDATLPDISTGDLLVMGIAYIPNPGPTTTPSTAVQLGTTFGADATLQMDTTPRIKAVMGAATTNGTANPLGQLTPWAVLVDRTNTRGAMLTKQEALAVAVGGAGKNLLIGGDNIQSWLSSGWTYCDVVAFKGAAARRSNAQIKTIWQTVGWTIAW